MKRKFEKLMFELSIAERKRILNRIFPNGCIQKRERPSDDDTYLGYTSENDVVEVRFWLGCNIDFVLHQSLSNTEKRKLINWLVNTALATNNNNKESVLFDINDNMYYFISVNYIGFTLCIRNKEEKQTV